VSCYAGIQVRRHSPHGWWKQRTVHPPSASTRPAGRATGVEGGRPRGTGRSGCRRAWQGKSGGVGSGENAELSGERQGWRQSEVAAPRRMTRQKLSGRTGRCLAWPPAAALREGGRVGVSGARRRSRGWKFGRQTKETQLGSSLFLGRWKKKGNGREGNVGRQV
jgi:hypothetical protein